MCIAKFLNKIKNGNEIIHIESFNIIGELNKILQTSQGSRKPMKSIKVKVVIKKVVRENISNFFLKSENVPLKWKKTLLKNLIIKIINKIKIVAKDIFLLYKWKQ